MQPALRKKYRPLCHEPTNWMDLVGSKCVSSLAEKFQVRLNAALVQLLEHYGDHVERASHAQLLASFTRVKAELRDFRDSLRPSERAQKHRLDVHVDPRTALPTVVCSLAELPLLYMRVVRNYGEKMSGVEFWLDVEGEVGATAAQAEREMEAEAMEKGEVSVPDVLEMWFRKGMEILVSGQGEGDGAVDAASPESAGGALKERPEKPKCAADDKRLRGAKRKPPGNGQAAKKIRADTPRKRSLPERSSADVAKAVLAKKARRSPVGGQRLSSAPIKNTTAGHSKNKRGLKTRPVNDKATNVSSTRKAAVSGKSRDVQRVSMSPREIMVAVEPSESERMQKDTSTNPSNRNARPPSPFRLIGNRSPMTPRISRRGGASVLPDAQGAIKRSRFAPGNAQPTAAPKPAADQPSNIVHGGGIATSLDRANVAVSGGECAKVREGLTALAPRQTTLLPTSPRSRDVSRGLCEKNVSPIETADAGAIHTSTATGQGAIHCNVISPNTREKFGEYHNENALPLPQARQLGVPLVSQITSRTLHPREPYPSTPLGSIVLDESAPTDELGRQVLSTEAACLQNAGVHGHHVHDSRTYVQPTLADGAETLTEDPGRLMRQTASKALPRDTEVFATPCGVREVGGWRAPRSVSHHQDEEGAVVGSERLKLSCGVATPPSVECQGVTTSGEDMMFRFTAAGSPKFHTDETGAALCTF